MQMKAGIQKGCNIPIQIRIEEEALEKEFQEKGTFERKGGKRYGYWEILRIAMRNGVFAVSAHHERCIIPNYNSPSL